MPKKIDFSSMSPRDVEAHLRQEVLRYFGNSVEDSTRIKSSHGFYTLEIDHGAEKYSFGHFRKKDCGRVCCALKFLAGK